MAFQIQKETTANAGTLRTRSSGNAVFDRLVAAGQRLLTVITRNKGGANKDLSKFADQINSLCDKWDSKAVRWLEERLCY